MDDLTAIPSTITAGDSYGIVLSYSDYPATLGWSVEFAINGVRKKTWASVAEDADHRLTLTADETADLDAGTYRYMVRVTDGSSVRTLQSGALTVDPNFAALPEGAGTSYAERTLAVVESALNGTIQGGMKMYMIGGRQVMTLTVDELRKLRSQLQAEVQMLRTQTFGTPVQFNVVGLR